MSDFLKQRSGAPHGFFAAEAAGLKWLSAPEVIPVVDVINVGEDVLRLERLTSVPPSPEAAAEFGRRLAHLHDSGAPAFGWAPAEPAWFGPLDSPFEVPVKPTSSFSDFWVDQRLQPVADDIADQLTPEENATVASAITAVGTGAFDGIAGSGAESPSRVHGDLWSGNLMWTPAGGTLIDPAAHGGHRLEDLAMLALFGTPFLDEIFAGYETVHPMPESWRADLPAHNLFALLAHVRLFGRGFLGQTLGAAREVTDRGVELGA
ncbi:fructosamine kinase family protein [Brevibacterium casei]|uniref:Fructosamine-3-kinase n=2 Tax=Brevibacterium casei TaxID=33889 RepID=K9B2Z9_9MICO|nr:fructosamine kinase family protein [Brevibacterium casei]NJE65842.1 fructosamine kinase [Brevibacterium sp. LS14]EKU49192.1 fructosamine-3-kinase [Brevibacterium casei S18]KZE15256.1 fructosamine kinase [Brevibacterium casei]MBE4695755.1 phosphotransferase [Brevibacterium casei]MBY3578877.1 phosphotransferase [Brevibacterium casei]